MSRNEKLKIKIGQRVFQQWPILVLFLINFLFFYRLFYPETKIFTTPDFGLSDILHFNYPLRFILAQFLKRGQLPLWVSKMGGGFPLFATGQTGAFNLVVFLTTFFFSAAVGFNLTYVFVYLLMGVFTYLFLRLWRLSKVSSLLGALVFSFSGSNITHFAHTDHLLTVSFLPLVFYALELALRRRSLKGWILFAIGGSQMLLAGNTNAAVYGFFAVGVYFLGRLLLIWLEVKNSRRELKRNRKVIEIVFFTLLAGVFLLGLSAVQLLPSLELTALSERTSSTWASSAQVAFPYPPKHLLTFLNPYLFGDPHKGTYPIYGKDWGLFWENTGYVGLIPLALAVFSIIAALTKAGPLLESRVQPLGWRTQVFFWTFLTLLSLTLSLGKYTPLFFILKFPILNLFRIPSTFLFVADFALAILAGFGLDFLIKSFSPRNFSLPFSRPQPSTLNSQSVSQLSTSPSFYLSILLPLLTLIDLWAFGYNYNPLGKASDWEKPPQTAEFLQKDLTDFRIFSPLSSFIWDQLFTTSGWKSGAEEYLSFRNGLSPDINLLYGIPSADFYAGVSPQRLAYLRSLLVDTIQVADRSSQKELWFSEESLKILNLLGVKYLVTPGIVNDPHFELISGPVHGEDFRIYLNQQAFPRVRLVGDYEVAMGIETAALKITNSGFNPSQAVIVEKDPNLPILKEDLDSEVELIKDTDNRLEIFVRTNEDAILVLSDSFYPGWKAWVDGIEKEIIAANINQRAVVVPKGEHRVSFIYAPKWFKVGWVVSVLSWMLIGVSLLSSKVVGTLFRKTRPTAWYDV